MPENPGAAELIAAGIAAEEGGDPARAEGLYRAAVAADPASAKAHMNLGIALQERRAFREAALSHEEALRLDPTLHSGHFNLALVRLALDDTGAAERAFREALRLKPGFAEAWVGLAEVLEGQGRDLDAVAALRKAIALREGYVGALFNAAVILRRLGRLDEAEALLRDIPEEHPDFGNAMVALAAILRDQGRVGEAVAALTLALSHSAPGAWGIESERLFTLGYSDQVGAEQLFAEHFMAGCRLEAATPRWRTRFSNGPDPERVLRVGYLSGDFRGHSVARFVESLFERHHRDRVRVFAYSSTQQRDSITARFAALADTWRDLADQPDAAVADAVLADEVDILVDLSGHTSGARVAVLAGRAAPLQMTWLGYINTTGLTRVDYRITDAVADPPGWSEALHVERLVRLPHSQWCFRPPDAARTIAAVRDADVPAFTFGVLNQFAKVSDASIALWVSVLKAVPRARLLVVNVPGGSATARLERSLGAAGVHRSRYDLIERVPQEQYYRQYARVDACLDTTPYSGGTTTCDALYLGVPVLTLAGRRPISRSSASLLTTVGLADLVADTPAAFLAVAARLERSGRWSNEARAALRAKMLASPLMDEEGFTTDLENLYRRVWRDWCTGRSRG